MLSQSGIILLLGVIMAVSASSNSTTTTTCFSANTAVDTLHRGTVKITELKAGDFIKTFDFAGQRVEYSKFVDYLHYDRSIETEFLAIRVKGSQKAMLEISPMHLIQRRSAEGGNSEFVFARDLNVKDEISILEGNEMSLKEIESIESFISVGAFAPLTESGTLLANNVYVSCYANCYWHNLVHFAFEPLRIYHRVFENQQQEAKLDDFFHGYVNLALKLISYSPISSLIKYWKT